MCVALSSGLRGEGSAETCPLLGLAGSRHSRARGNPSSPYFSSNLPILANTKGGKPPRYT